MCVLCADVFCTHVSAQLRSAVIMKNKRSFLPRSSWKILIKVACIYCKFSAGNVRRKSDRDLSFIASAAHKFCTLFHFAVYNVLFFFAIISFYCGVYLIRVYLYHLVVNLHMILCEDCFILVLMEC